MGRRCWKIWWLGCLLAGLAVAQAPPAETPPDDSSANGTAAADENPGGGENGLEEGVEDGAEDASPRRRGVLSEFQRMLRTKQSHLTEDGGGSPYGAGLILALLVLAYVFIVLIVLAIWRRSRDPKMWRLRTETMQGEGRWSMLVAYAIRRKIDAEVTLQMVKVEPAGSGVQLAYLVEGEIKGRLGEGGEAKVRFASLKPKSFWQSDQQDSIAIGFELIQPRDKKITLHLDVRAEYRIGKKSGVAGLFQEALSFAPSMVGKTLEVLEDASPSVFETPSGMPVGGLDDTGGLGYPSMPAVGQVGDPAAVHQLRLQQGELEQRLHLMESRFLSESAPTDDLERRLMDLENHLESLPTALGVGDLPQLKGRLQQVEDQCAALRASSEPSTGSQGTAASEVSAAEVAALRREMRAAEERAANALRENLQVVVKNMKGLRHELTQLNTAVNDMMQRFVNSERRLADVMKRLPPET